MLTGCFYPSKIPPRTPEKDQVLIDVPYDLVWDSVLAVIKSNGYHIQAQDPTHGIIEAQAHKFTLDDADCGQIGSLGGKFPAEPGADVSAEYNFYVKAAGRESTTVAIVATFAAPLRVPFHTLTDEDCVSKGVQEARLLKEVEEQASITRRPEFKKPSG